MCRIADIVRNGAFLHPFITVGTSMSGHTGVLYIDKNQKIRLQEDYAPESSHHLKEEKKMENSKNRKNGNKKLTAALVVLCLVTVCMIGGTMAKYVSGTTGTSTATVAKWSIGVNGKEIAVSPETTVDFNLFTTVNEEDTATVEANVTDGKIAPGTGGSFRLVIENKSEVDAKYTIALDETNVGDVPIEYSLDKTTWSGDMSAINTAQKDIAIARESGAESVTVYWRWAFEGDDASDTALGIAARTAAPNVQITAAITATQVD